MKALCWRAGLALILLAGCQRAGPRAAGPLPHEAYIWQRVWTPPVVQAVAQARGELAGFVPLAAEVTWHGAAQSVTRPAVRYEALAGAGRPVGLALRIGPFPGPFRAEDETTRALCAIARSVLAEARAQGVEPAELQVDFDCADAKLAGYRIWLRALADAVRPTPVCPTVLPGWLRQRDFPPLAREAGRYVLQVHATEPPRDADDMQLCDPVRAARWVEDAGKIGVPFRVALPTYTYLVAFDAAGKLAGISAEDAPAAWPADAHTRLLRADARALSALVQGWTRDRPAALTGVIWYRLPAATDTMNWRWPTLAAIAAGRTPRSSLRAVVTGAQPLDLALVNDGELDEQIPSVIEVVWSESAPASADALAGFTLESGPGFARFRAAAELREARLSPGEKRAIGWLRFDEKKELHVTLRQN